MSTRLEIINNALVSTGNNALNVEYDGTPEWQAADVGYRRAVSWATASGAKSTQHAHRIPAASTNGGQPITRSP